MRMYHDVSGIDTNVNALIENMGLDTHMHSDTLARDIQYPDIVFDVYLMAFASDRWCYGIIATHCDLLFMG